MKLISKLKMAAEEKSDDINFDNEQEEQRTLGSDEERKIKKQEEHKIYTKSKERKNKSQNRLYKSRLPPIKISKKGKQLYKGMPQPKINVLYSPNNFNNINKQNNIDDEELYPEIKVVKKEIKNLNKELKNMKNEYYIMEEQNLTYKYMIEKILKSKQNNKDNNTINEKNENENNRINEKTNEEEEFKNNEKNDNENKNERSPKKKSKKNKPKSDAEIKISVLKKQNDLYDNALFEKENKLESLRKNEKSIQYQQLVNSLNLKTDEF